jgi:limonene-1,2-epoxide hydrolase
LDKTTKSNIKGINTYLKSFKRQEYENVGRWYDYLPSRYKNPRIKRAVKKIHGKG